MNKIPRVCYAYWGAPCLPYLRYMCMKSFLQFNPGWDMILFIPKKLVTSQSWQTYENKQVVDTIDYMDRLKGLGVIVQEWDMENIGYSNDLPEVTKSDILRLHLLSGQGGLWTDTDIIYFHSLQHSVPNTDFSAAFCYRRGGPTQEDTAKNGPKYHSIGFMMGCTQSDWFKRLWWNLPKVIDMDNYQSMGSPYYKTVIADKEFGASGADLYNFDINVVYPSRAVPGMWNPASEYIPQIWDNCIGWHWYCGHPKSGEMQNLITEKTYHHIDNVVCWITNRVNQGIPVTCS